jgi:uncharacterized protein (DUF2141 family)
MRRIIIFIFLLVSIVEVQSIISGCAQIIAPTGGPRDTIPPVLVTANPKQHAINFTGNRINLYFDEYVQIQELQQNLLISPTPIKNPYIDFKLRSVTIRLRDTLEPNTTYTIDLGNSIRDINENNVLKNFRYVFSTGTTIDSLSLSGKVKVAETGLVDSTLIVMLYKNLNDSAVQKLKPKYIAKLDGQGNFSFENLAPGEYKVYAIKDADGGRTYNSKLELVAFNNTSVIVSDSTAPVSMYAFAEEKEKPKVIPNKEKKLLYTTNITTQKMDVLTDLSIEFNKPLKNVDKQKIQLTDTLNNPVKDVVITIDSTNKKFLLKTKWVEDASYKLIIAKDFATDSTGLALANSDTVRFKTKGESDYGILKFKFKNFDKTKNPVLQFVQNNEVVKSYPLTSEVWSAPQFNPGEYDLRILFDENKNGIWDTGNFEKKKQPEKVFAISQKLSVRENFEKDIDIELQSPL